MLTGKFDEDETTWAKALGKETDVHLILIHFYVAAYSTCILASWYWT